MVNAQYSKGTTPFSIDLPLLEALAQALRAKGQMLRTAESCTGGLIAATCTELAGSSEWFDRGFVTYSNAAKQELLGVPLPLLTQFGAVSEAVARAMAQGALGDTSNRWAVAVTGIAGPSGGSPDKPVGTVWIAWAGPSTLLSRRFIFEGDRQKVRQKTLEEALKGLLSQLLT